MADTTVLTAQTRERAGKGAARATRRAGRVPAVIYGNKIDPEIVSLDGNEFTREWNHTGFFSRIYEIAIDGKKQRVLARDVQTHPVNDRPLHVDFLRFSATTVLNVEVDVHFINEDECPGIREGGVLNVVRHTVEVMCRPDDMPESLTVDLTGLAIGDSVHISHVALPDGVEPAITDRDFTIATIAAPTLTPAEEDEAEEGEEGEAIEGEESAEDTGEEESEAEEGGEDS